MRLVAYAIVIKRIKKCTIVNQAIGRADFLKIGYWALLLKL